MVMLFRSASDAERGADTEGRMGAMRAERGADTEGRMGAMRAERGADTEGRMAAMRARFPHHDLRVIRLEGAFSRGRALHEGSALYGPDALLVFIDVDMYIAAGLLDRILANTVQNKSVSRGVMGGVWGELGGKEGELGGWLSGD